MKLLVFTIYLLALIYNLKGEWYNNGKYISLNISDSSVTYAKFNDSRTKLFAYSAKEKKTRMWDLSKGIMIEENYFPFKITAREYDFKNDYFYFVNKGDTSLKNDNMTTIWYRTKSDSLKNIKFEIKLNNTNGNIQKVTDIPLLKLINNKIVINFTLYSTTEIPSNYYNRLSSVQYVVEIDDSTKISKIDLDGALLVTKYFEQGIVGELNQIRYNEQTRRIELYSTHICLISNYQYFIRNNDSRYGIVFNTGMNILEANYGNFIIAQSHPTLYDKYICKYLPFETLMPNSLYTDYPYNYARQLKFIENMNYCAYFAADNILQVYDNKLNEKISAQFFKEGSLYYSDSTKIIYSYTDKVIFKLDLKSVITSIKNIQDYAERKYIFKQDADGIYCQLEGEGEVSLYDNVGRLVRTYQIENERYIRKEDFERGVYFLSIQTNGNVYHEKVLVE